MARVRTICLKGYRDSVSGIEKRQRYQAKMRVVETVDPNII